MTRPPNEADHLLSKRRGSERVQEKNAIGEKGEEEDELPSTEIWRSDMRAG